MKPLLAVLLLALSFFTSHAQSGWPRNPKTGKVELQGTLPWPKDIKSEAQRRALVRRWYLAKLTVLNPAQVEAQAATNTTNGLLTYANLPKAALLRYGSGDSAYLLGYFVELSPTAKGLHYDFTSLDMERVSEVETSEATPLEQLLLNATPSEKAALAALRKRLTVALAGW
jgi:hypothetical protein